MSVQKAYIETRNGVARGLLSSNGKVYLPQQGWHFTAGKVVALAGSYDSWHDVPSAWLGGGPYWRSAA